MIGLRRRSGLNCLAGYTRCGQRELSRLLPLLAEQCRTRCEGSAPRARCAHQRHHETSLPPRGSLGRGCEPQLKRARCCLRCRSAATTWRSRRSLRGAARHGSATSSRSPASSRRCASLAPTRGAAMYAAFCCTTAASSCARHRPPPATRACWPTGRALAGLHQQGGAAGLAAAGHVRHPGAAGPGPPRDVRLHGGRGGQDGPGRPGAG